MYRPFRDDDADALARAHRLSFGFPDDDAAKKWWAGPVGGVRHLRVVEDDDGTVIGGLVDIPMGMFLGGRAVANHGLAAVGIVPEARGRGAATRLMRGHVEELHHKGIALASLYASTRSLYRGVGYEVAGSNHELTVPLAALSGTRTPPLRRATEEDGSAIEALYARVARHRDGHLDRGPYLWTRVRAFRDTPTEGFVVEEDGAVTGYVYYRLGSEPGTSRYRIEIHDLCAGTAAAGRRLLAFLGALGPIARELRMATTPTDPLLDLLPELRYQLALFEHWLVRLTHVERALEERGWPAGVALAVDLDVDDPLLPDNGGRWRVEVEGGGARVRRGGSGAARLDVRALASLYTGFSSPWDLRILGRLAADDATCAALASLFRGTAPSMPDRF